MGEVTTPASLQALETSGTDFYDPLPSRKEPRHAEVLAEDGGGTDCVVEEGSHKFQLRSRDRLQK